MDEEQFENYLREFEPKNLRALPELAAPPNWRRLAAAIVIFFLGATSLWNVHRQSHKKADTRTLVGQIPIPASTIPLTKLAVENPSEFEATLDARSFKTLQRFDRADSALRALAKE